MDTNHAGPGRPTAPDLDEPRLRSDQLTRRDERPLVAKLDPSPGTAARLGGGAPS